MNLVDRYNKLAIKEYNVSVGVNQNCMITEVVYNAPLTGCDIMVRASHVYAYVNDVVQFLPTSFFGDHTHIGFPEPYPEGTIIRIILYF